MNVVLARVTAELQQNRHDHSAPQSISDGKRVPDVQNVAGDGGGCLRSGLGLPRVAPL